MKISPAGLRSVFAAYQTIRWSQLKWAVLKWSWLPLFLCGAPRDALADDLTGSWQATSLQVSWAIGDWGKACGPRPSGGGERGGVVQITSTGSTGFTLQGLGRNYSSGQCWEQMPGLAPRGKALSSSTIQTTCRMPAGDPRQAKVVTSWYPRGDEIYFDETGQYQFVVSGSNCTASVRRTRVLTRIVAAPPSSEAAAEAGSAPAPGAAPKKDGTKPVSRPAPDRPPPPARSARCETPGEPVRAEVTPRSKLIRPGETFHFQALARDARGCRVPIPTVWEIKSGTGVTVDQKGVVEVAKNASPGSVTLLAQMGDQKVEVSARVVSDAEYEELIAGGDYGAQGESHDAATVELASSHVEFEKTRQLPTSTRGALWWGSWAALVGLLLALLVYLLKRRPKQQAVTGRSAESGDERPGRPSLSPEEELARTQTAPSDAGHEPGTHSKRLCPVCGRRYEETTAFCVDDGARLVRVN